MVFLLLQPPPPRCLFGGAPGPRRSHQAVPTVPGARSSWAAGAPSHHWGSGGPDRSRLLPPAPRRSRL